MDTSGANRRALTAPGAGRRDDQPTFAPDGTQIVFERWLSTAPEASPLLVMNADGSDEHLISGASEYLYRPAWQHRAPAADDSAPGATLGAPDQQSVRDGGLYLFATSNETAAGVASGKVAIRALARTYRLRPTTKALPANTRTRIRVNIPIKPLRAIRAALARHSRLKARIVVSVEDSAGNATAEALTIRLKLAARPQ